MQFKLEAVRLATQPGASVTGTAENLGINQSLRQKWKTQLTADGVPDIITVIIELQ